ncbi:hypothetical protein [Actinomycetospora sp. NBRC 106378]|uniref:hypothetical protein n=1 Tax=Actinomycetospora sp. NBRC 106378 TaxID=3032208 RepID=UPI0024A40D45|nr:hypothetical protein [Actinomycetospora sp. NBRC 106378]GLZ56370.1 hypothetical protein Acsp07_59870 [Actinomycetospora sp. NBRC 106378]
MPDATTSSPAEPETTTKASATGLTLPQIIAGALAAATAAILGSFLGVIGTIGGAAAASVISTVGSALYQRSLERTRDAVKSRLVVNAMTGTKVARGAAPQAGPPNPARPGMPPRPGVPGQPGPMMSPPFGAPIPPGAPVPPGVPTRRLANGVVVPVATQQLRGGGRTVVTRLDAAGRPTGEPVDPTRRIPNSRTPGGGNPTQVVPPLGPDGRPLAGPTRQMPMGGSFPPSGGQPTAHLAHGPGGDDPTALASAVEESTPWYRRFGWKTWVTLGGVAASVFAIGLLASFAVESATGHPLSGGTSGTSVGSIFGQNTQAPATTESSDTQDPGSSDATTTTSSDQGSGNQEGAERSTTTTRAPSTSTSQAPQNPLSSLVPRFNEQGGSTGN